MRDNSPCGVREMNLNHENEKIIEEYSSLQKGQTKPELTGVEHDDTENWEEYGKIGGSCDSDANQTQDEDGKHNKMKLIKKMQINPEIMLQRRNLMVGETSRGRKDNYRNVNALCLPSDPQQTSQLRLAIHPPCNSVSDIDINNCNRLFWIRNNSLEALRL